MNQFESRNQNIERLEKENASLRKELEQIKKQQYCHDNGHKWFRWHYCSADGTNYLTCERCGAQKTD